jgi:hypothetical protein
MVQKLISYFIPINVYKKNSAVSKSLEVTWNNGELVNVMVRSTAGMPLLLRYKENIKAITTEKNGVYTFDGLLRML